MKKITLFALAIIIVMSIFSCSKKNATTTPSVVGYWAGVYGNGIATPSIFYSFLIRSNGTVRIYANNADTAAADLAVGNYSYTSSTITINKYSYINGTGTYSVTGTLSADGKTWSGTWGAGANTTGGGTFSVTKQ
ncbi:MAG: hypothetical protein KGM98_09765 [Bacteroidota bacterium]|nr:hypothetical protein [Bacteroidota bacterium]